MTTLARRILEVITSIWGAITGVKIDNLVGSAPGLLWSIRNVSLEEATSKAYGLAMETSPHLAEAAERSLEGFPEHFAQRKSVLTWFAFYFHKVVGIPIYGNMKYSPRIERVNLQGFDIVMDGQKLIATEIHGNRVWESMFVKRADLKRALDKIKAHENERESG
jgi:hypothetical protein